MFLFNIMITHLVNLKGLFDNLDKILITDSYRD